jgi:electron transport complex protein RnfC
MLMALLKPYDELLPLVENRMVALICEGCREVYFPESEVIAMRDRLLVNRTASKVITSDYLCSFRDDISLLQHSTPDKSSLKLPSSLESCLQNFISDIEAADALLVFSCGVGVQTIAEMFSGTPVYAACDTYPLPGCQGVTPLEFDCAECGECYLNSTGGICPVTACSKSLVNGQCGGAKNGNCEVDNERECGWVLIYRRLRELKMLDVLSGPVIVRNYNS